jgi:hypothetical protein
VTIEPDGPTPARRRKQPSLHELDARRKQDLQSLGRWGRLRSWGTILVGLLALAVLAAWMAMVR